MATWARCHHVLCVMVLISLLMETTTFELDQIEWSEMRSDVSSLHRLKGVHDHIYISQSRRVRRQLEGQTEADSARRLMTSFDGLWHSEHPISYIIQHEQTFKTFVETVEEQKVEDKLLHASELSYVYGSELLIMLDDEKETVQRAEQEYHLYPQYSTKINRTCLLKSSCIPAAVETTVVKIFGTASQSGHTLSGYSGSDLATLMLRPALRSAHVFSFDANVSDTMKFKFMKTFQFRDMTPVVETSNENYLRYEVLDNRDEVIQHESLKKPVDHTTQYDWQNILIMEDDPVVREAATYLYEKHPRVSSVYRLENGEPKLIEGPPVPLTQDSRLVIVGHGRKTGEGTTIAGYKAEDVADIISHMDRDGDQIKTVSVAACDCGSDEGFMGTLITELNDRSIDTELHFRSSLLQVNHDGSKTTWELTPDGYVGKHQDHTKKLVVRLDNKGEVIIQQYSDYRGDYYFSDHTNFLMFRPGVAHAFPNQANTFVRRPYPQLEAFTRTFYSQWKIGKLDRPPITAQDKYLIYSLTFKDKAAFHKKPGWWIENPKDIDTILHKSFEIRSAEDMMNAIKHYARAERNAGVSYLIINDWMFHVHAYNLYVFPVGKRLSNNEKDDVSKITTIKEYIEETFGKEQYKEMRDKIKSLSQSKHYADYALNTINGDHVKGSIPLEEELHLTRYFTASVISESARNFRTFPVILMALQLSQSNNEQIREKAYGFLLENHPMASGGTWISTDKRGFDGAIDPGQNEKKIKNLVKLMGKEDAICKTFFSEFENIPEALTQLYRMVKKNGEGLDTFISSYEDKLNVLQPQKPPGTLGGSYDGHVTQQEVHSATEIEHSLRLSSYYTQISDKLPQHVEKQLKEDLGDKFTEYQIKPDSIRYDNGKIQCQLISDTSPEKEWTMAVPKEQQDHLEKIRENMKEVSDIEFSDSETIHRNSENMEKMGKAVGAVGLMVGIQGAVHAFERGDTVNGIVGSLQTAQGITEMSVAAVAKASVTSELKVLRTAKVLMESPVGRKALQILPIVGIGFGIYNVEEDFRRHDTLGYIDGALDSSILAIDVVETVLPITAPLLVPISLGITVLRMVTDDVYMGIHDELAKLPENAGLLEKCYAVSIGLFKGIDHFAMNVASFFYTMPYQEIEEGRKLVESISDYHNYYQLHEVEAGRKAIDFSSGGASWNAGNITFFLLEGQSILCMDYFVSSDEQLGKSCWDVETGQTKDIVLGTGESHALEYSEIQRKVLMFIPAGHVTVVSGYKVVSNTRYGTYYGDEQDNHFFAVQTNKDEQLMKFMMSYHYKLFGRNGDDIFHLGPQRSNVAGQGGKDSYIISETGGNTNINNYDPDKSPDVLMFSVNYSNISVSKSGDDVILHYFIYQKVRLLNWFIGEQFQHINLMSADGVLFEIVPVPSVKLIARGVNKMSEKIGQRVDTSEPLLSSVNNIMGSPFDDHLLGNKQKNIIDGGGGVDYVKGAEGEDIYVVKERQNSRVQIENYSPDNEYDMVIIEADFHSFKTKVDGHDLILMPFEDMNSSVTLKYWFRSEADRHLVVLTKDLITFTFSANMELCKQPDPIQSKCILSQSIDYRTSESPLHVNLSSDDALQNVTHIYGSKFDDNIIGNANRNTIIPGEGEDFLQGLGGEDWYIVNPGQGLKTIDNYSPDLVQDKLFLMARYELIECRCERRSISSLPTSISLSGMTNGRNKRFIVLSPELQLFVQLKDWFTSPKSQHLQVQSSDGITFHLIQDPKQCGGPMKIPVSVDHTNDSQGKTMHMDQKEFATVVQMNGSAGFDDMVGNEEDNLLDPYTGGGRMRGGNGSDTYVVKHLRNVTVEIDNYALDRKDDNVLFDANFLHDQITVQVDQYDIVINTFRKGYEAQTRLLNYTCSKNYQHLTFQSNDGIRFRVRSSPDQQAPWLEAYKVKLPDSHKDCGFDLSNQGNLSSIHTVHGCPQQSNHLLGNKLDNALFGGVKDDGLEGGPGDDTLMGGKGNDILMGNTGNDTLYGEEGDDMMLGGSGDDIFIPGPGADELDGGSGRDTVLYQGDHKTGKGVYVNLLTGEGLQADAEGDVLKDIENVIGTIYSDVLISGYESTLLKGSDGDDVLVSVVGDDYLIGGEGKDVYMLTSQQRLLTIDNCAQDDAPDVLYLHFLSRYFVTCSRTADWLSLKFGIPDKRAKDGGSVLSHLRFLFRYLVDWLSFKFGISSTVELRLMNWQSSSHRCGHLILILREGATTVEDVC